MTSTRARWVHLYEFGAGHQPGRDAWAKLCEDELARAARILDPVRRRRFVARGVALSTILSRYGGRPVYFNSADSGDAVAVAVAGRPVGVDIEVERPRRQERIAARMFAPDERSVLEAVDGDLRRRLFHRCWVAKEAYAKARRRGLAMRFDEFSVAPALRAHDGTGHVADGWTLSVQTRGETHVAVASRGGDREIVEVRRG